MKKNKMMRTASGLLALTLLTTGVISGTFAKYTTEDSAYDVARVAKWGVTLQATGSLYGDKYTKGDAAQGGNKVTSSTSDITVSGSQIANDGTYTAVTNSVVAPGTESDSGFSFALNGKPEVTSKIEMKILSSNIELTAGNYGVMAATDKVTSQNIKELAENGLYKSADATTFEKVSTDNPSVENGVTYYTLEDQTTTADYFPVVYTLEGNATNGTSYTGDYSKDTMAEISEAIGKNIGSVASSDGNGSKSYTITSKVCDPNTDLNETLKLGNELLTWKWEYETANKAVTDGADTILGDLIAQVTDPAIAADTIVVKETSTDTGDTYKKVTVQKQGAPFVNLANQQEADNVHYFATLDGEDELVANLSTYFYIDIAVTQVD